MELNQASKRARKGERADYFELTGTRLSLSLRFCNTASAVTHLLVESSAHLQAETGMVGLDVVAECRMKLVLLGASRAQPADLLVHGLSSSECHEIRSTICADSHLNVQFEA